MISTLITIYFVLGIFVTAFCVFIRFRKNWSELNDINNLYITIMLYFGWGYIVPLALYRVFTNKGEGNIES